MLHVYADFKAPRIALEQAKARNICMYFKRRGVLHTVQWSRPRSQRCRAAAPSACYPREIWKTRVNENSKRLGVSPFSGSDAFGSLERKKSRTRTHTHAYRYRYIFMHKLEYQQVMSRRHSGWLQPNLRKAPWLYAFSLTVSLNRPDSPGDIRHQLIALACLCRKQIASSCTYRKVSEARESKMPGGSSDRSFSSRDLQESGQKMTTISSLGLAHRLTLLFLYFFLKKNSCHALEPSTAWKQYWAADKRSGLSFQLLA